MLVPLGTAFTNDIAVFSDMQELFLVDPIHDVDDAGWPSRPPEGN